MSFSVAWWQDSTVVVDIVKDNDPVEPFIVKAADLWDRSVFELRFSTFRGALTETLALCSCDCDLVDDYLESIPSINFPDGTSVGPELL